MVVAKSRTVDPSHLVLFASTMYMSSAWLVLGDIVNGNGWIVIHLRKNIYCTLLVSFEHPCDEVSRCYTGFVII